MLPSLSLFMGNIAVAFSEDQEELDNLQGTLGEISIAVIMVAVGLTVCSYVQYAFWQHVATRITLKLRREYLRTLM